MNKVNECPYCGGTFPHQGPTGCNQSAPDIDWMLTEPTGVAKVIEHYLVVERGGQSRVCVISYNSKGRMLFNGKDIDTEAFMAFVGMLDAVDESRNKRVLFEGETDMEEL